MTYKDTNFSPIEWLLLLPFCRATSPAKNCNTFVPFELILTMDKKKITVKELASLLGVSISTVSKALNDSYEISNETKLRVQSLAKKYNYKPNRIAVNLKSGNTNTIGVILPSILSNFFTTVLYGIEEVTTQENYSIITCFSNESHEREVTNTEILSNGSIDGLIVAIAEETQIKRDFNHFKACIDDGNPIVMFDRVTDGISCDKVVVDDFKDAYLATQHLIDRGCSKIVAVSTIDFLSVGKMRIKGFQKALDESFSLSKEPNVVRSNVVELESNLKTLLQTRQVDAFFAVDEDSSLAAEKVVKKMGLRIPQDVCIIGYAGEKLAANLSPSLTTVNQNGIEIGRSAARIMIDRLKNKDLDFVTKIVKTQIEHRSSS